MKNSHDAGLILFGICILVALILTGITYVIKRVRYLRSQQKEYEKDVSKYISDSTDD